MGVLDSFSLAGKTALVTGGAGVVGQQLVRAIAEAGAATFVASRNLDSLKALQETFNADGLSIIPLQYDQSEEDSIFVLRDAILAETGRIDVLINNSVSRPMKKAYQDDAAAFEASMQVNATGLFMITRAMGDVMAAQGNGSIVNIASIQGVIAPDPTIYEGTDMSGWYPDYYFHKGGMINFTRFIASYYGAKGVRCNCMSPGGVQTESHPEIFLKHYSDRTFLGRLINQTDLMGAAVFLASDASVYVTGVNLMIDGGYTAK
ncbi:MAG: SDR family oxidoreductase [Candidatus Hydrogenedentes bacterium]|nr:SDR family oxidoreductase [Candidatus Hydrogenedentota bacterium]